MAKTMNLHLPEDQKLLAAFGRIAIVHEHLNHVLVLTIMTLAELMLEEAIDATRYDGSRQLRKRISRLARQRLGEGQPLLKLQALLTRCGRATEKRNELIHSVLAKEVGGDPKRRSVNHEWQELPTVGELNELGQELIDLLTDLSNARLSGFLMEALAKPRG